MKKALHGRPCSVFWPYSDFQLVYQIYEGIITCHAGNEEPFVPALNQDRRQLMDPEGLCPFKVFLEGRSGTAVFKEDTELFRV